MKKIWKEFKEFAFKGNVIDMAVGVMIGSAFSKIVTSLVNDIFMPLLSVLTGSVSFTDLAIALGDGLDNGADLLGNAALTADDLAHVVGGDAQLQRQFLIALDLRDGDRIGIINEVSGDVEQQVFHDLRS